MTETKDYNDVTFLRSWIMEVSPELLSGRPEFYNRLDVVLDIPVGRIETSKQGGLSFDLFPGVQNLMPTQFHVRTLPEVIAVQEYFKSVMNYLDAAKEHARAHELGLVRNLGDRIVPVDTPELSCLEAGPAFYDTAWIGSPNINSVKDLQQFYDMIKSGRHLDDMLNGIHSKIAEQNQRLCLWRR